MDREIRDPIHGFIKRTSVEEKLIDTKAFQRLRGIKQLAMANLVYPGALHTRFDHSIGVMHIASKILEHLKLEDADKISIVRYAALLHDIGHGPFSHVSEEVLKHYSKEKLSDDKLEKTHETITCKIIEKDPEISRLISDDQREKIINLLKGEKYDHVCKSIISGPLDADKQDYLLRDSYYCGVKYGVYDVERLISMLKKIEDIYSPTIGILYEGIYVLEQFVMAKYHMTTQVYKHKTRLLTDAMIQRALKLGIDVDNLEFLRKLYTFEDSEDYIKNYLEWDDNRLVNKIIHDTDGDLLSKSLFINLKSRILHKRIFSTVLTDLPLPTALKLRDCYKSNEFIASIEEKIAEIISSELNEKVNKDLVIFKLFSLKSIVEHAKDDEGTILVYKQFSNPISFFEQSEIFRYIKEAQSQYFVEVYAPVRYKSDEDKSRILDSLKEKINQSITEIVDSFKKEEGR
ncbi:MAG: HD domain-containing protein [bacterium]